MAKRDGQGIGHVGWLRKLIQPEFPLNGRLHLCFGRTPIARQNLLYLSCRVMLNGNTGLCRRQADHAAGMPHQDRRPRTLVVRVEFLECELRWLIQRDHIGQSFVDFGQTRWQLAPGPATNHPRFNKLRSTVALMQNSVAGGIQPGIDTEDLFHLSFVIGNLSFVIGTCHLSLVTCHLSVFAPRRSVFPVFERDADLGQGIANTIGRGKILVLAGISSHLDEELDQVVGQLIVAGSGGGFLE